MVYQEAKGGVLRVHDIVDSLPMVACKITVSQNGNDIYGASHPCVGKR